MGTRRSKHNQGRKPLYKEHRTALAPRLAWDSAGLSAVESSVEEILAHKPYGGLWLNQGTNWTGTDTQRLEVLCKAEADISLTADALGRVPKSIAYKARDLGLALPVAWKSLLPKPKYVPRPREVVVQLTYPFIIKARRDEHADLITVNALVPKNYPDDMRADICQEMLLALYAGKVNLATLQGPRGPQIVREFVSRWRKENLENGGYGVASFDPFADERAYDEIASSIAARDWQWQEMNDRRSAYEAVSAKLTPPTQLDHVYENEVYRAQSMAHQRDIPLTWDDAHDLISSGSLLVRQSDRRNLVADRIGIAVHLRHCGLECDPIAFNAAYVGRGGRQSQYLWCEIPHSSLQRLKMRISDHPLFRPSPDGWEPDLDTFRHTVGGVKKMLTLLASDLPHYEAIFRKHLCRAEMLRALKDDAGVGEMH